MSSDYNLPAQRSLNIREENALKLLQYVEVLVEGKHLFGALSMPQETLDALHRLDVAEPLKAVYDPRTKVYSVRFLLPELFEYVHFVCGVAGLTLQVDGSVKTHDNYTLTVEGLN